MCIRDRDIIGIGGDINYPNFLDSEMLMDISDYRGLADINPSYLTIDKQLEFIPMNGTYAVSYTHLDVYKRQVQNRIGEHVFFHKKYLP